MHLKKIAMIYVVIGVGYTVLKRQKDESLTITLERGALWPIKMLGS